MGGCPVEMDKLKEEMNTKAIAELKKEIEEINGKLASLASLGTTIDAIRETQKKMVDVSLNTNENVHEAKHGALGTQRNMSGFKDQVAKQYEKFNGVIAELRIVVAELRVERKYTEEDRLEMKGKMELIEDFVAEQKAIQDTVLSREIVEEMKAFKAIRIKFVNGWWWLAGIALVGAAIAGIITAVKAIGNLFK